MPVLSSTVAAGWAVLLVAVSYLVGTFPTAVLVTRRRGIDPTRTGSGNPGATNVLRVAGRRAGAAALVGDVLKGAVPAAVGWAVGGHGLGVACGLAAVVGHVLPVTRGFRGGKGVATGAGMAVVLFPAAALVAVAAFAVAAVVSRTVSLGVDRGRPRAARGGRRVRSARRRGGGADGGVGPDRRPAPREHRPDRPRDRAPPGNGRVNIASRSGRHCGTPRPG